MKTLRLLSLAALIAGCHVDQLFKAPDNRGPSPESSGPRLVFTTPPEDATAARPITPAIRVTVQDSTNQPLTSFDDSVTVDLGANPAGGTLSGTRTVEAVDGVATFPDLRIDKAGSGYTLRATASSVGEVTSPPFEVVPPPPPTTGNLTVTAATSGQNQDPDGYTVTVDGGQSKSIANDGSVTYDGLTAGDHTVELSGVASNCTVNGANPRTVSVPAGSTAQTEFAVSCEAPPPPPPVATHLVFTAQPSNTLPFSTIRPQVEVTAVDDAGNRVKSFTGRVTIAIGHDASLLGNANLSGTTGVDAVNGVARFNDLSIDQIGAGYTLRATAAGLTGAESERFNILTP
ncbi:MAG TPA: hypothetical protein VEK78_16735 [Gemmatimonadales bacterium]|nr:hypothetical protein [Gemmatimonadales bacterium]